jgi:two-component system, NtrC family, response regulator AtoC
VISGELCPRGTARTSVTVDIFNLLSSVSGNLIEKVRLLWVSREPFALKVLWSAVESNGWQLEVAGSAWDAIERVELGFAPQLLVLDLPRGEDDSFHILRWLRRLRPDLPVILVSYAEDLARKDESIRLGASDFLTRPVTEQQLEHTIRRHLGSAHHRTQAPFASENIEQLSDGVFFVGTSTVMHQLRAQVELLAQTDVPALIFGEAGSGRETIARLIHKLSARSEFRFMKVNCGALSGDPVEREIFADQAKRVSDDDQYIPGVLESGDKGTIFFNEITNLPLHLQEKLLHALQKKSPIKSGDQGQVGVRILAAAGENVETAVWGNTLREDLYYHLRPFTVHVPPLRQRKDEIPLLLEHFMYKLARYYNLLPRELSSAVLAASQRYSWPGNLRELENFVKRYLIIGDVDVTMGWSNGVRSTPSRSSAHLSSATCSMPMDAIEASTGAPMSLKSLVKNVKCEAERNAIAAALEKTGWNRKAAAQLLKVSYRTMLNKIVEYNMRFPKTYSPAGR